MKMSIFKKLFKIKNNLSIILSSSLSVFTLLAILTIGLFFAAFLTYAWNPPNNNPPNSTNQVLYINSSGNVGIGTANPTQKLSVNGIIESITGGFKFPNGTTQMTAAVSIENKSSNYTLTTSDSGKIFTNVGATTSITFTLPTSTINYIASFEVIANQTITITPQVGETLTIAGTTLTAGTPLSTSVVGSRFEIMAVGTGGYIVKMKGVQPKFVAKRTGNQALSGTIWTKVQFNNEITDNNNNYDPTTNFVFSPTIPGEYLLRFRVYMFPSVAGSQYDYAIYKNGVLEELGFIETPILNGDYAPDLVVTVTANGTTDYFEVRARVSVDAIIDGSYGTIFSGRRFAD